MGECRKCRKFQFSDDNYKEDLTRYIDELYTQVKCGQTSTQEAIEHTQDMTDEYVKQVGERPDESALGRLGTILLYETLSDPTPWKMRNTEYPIESDRTARDYYAGLAGDIPVNLASDGSVKDLPKRRKRTDGENNYLNKRALRRNKERKRRRRDFISGRSPGVLNVKIDKD